jgi:acetyl-CoA acetyltransferase
MLIEYSTTKNPDDVVITLAIRTPLCKGFKGGFKDTDIDYMVYVLLKKVIEKSRLDPNLVEDICCGNVSPSDRFSYVHMMLTFHRSVMKRRHTRSVPPRWPPGSL